MEVARKDTLDGVVKKIVHEVLSARCDIEPDDIKETTSLQDDLGMDSFEGLLVMVAIEQEFNFVINKKDVPSVRTFGDMLKLVKGYASKRK